MHKIKKIAMFVVSSLVVVAVGLAILNRLVTKSPALRKLITGA